MKRILLHIAIAVLAIRLLWVFMIPAWSRITSDFPIYYTSAWAVRHGEPLMDLYDPYWFNRETARAGIPDSLSMFGVYPPFSALVLWPLADSAPIVARHFWTIFNLGVLGAVIVLVSRATSMSLGLVTLIALLGGDALGNNFMLGQFYIVLTLLMVLTLEYADRSAWLSGLSTAVGAFTKVFPGLLVVYLLLTRRWRACWWTLAGSVVIFATTLLLMGATPHAVFLRDALPRAIRGEILDPYNVHFNALQTLIRRAFILEPSLNPHPIANLPAVGFFLKSFSSMAIVLITFLTLQHSLSTERHDHRLFELGAMITAVLLITPAPGTHHSFLLFPGIVAAVDRFKSVISRYAVCGAFALACSNAMGAGARWDSGWSMLLAFPRAYLMLALWLVFIVSSGLFRMKRRPLLIGLGLVTVSAALFTSREVERWANDERDGAVMADVGSPQMMTYPTLAPFGFIYSAFQDGAVQHASSHFGKGFVSELRGSISGCCLEGRNFSYSGLTEPVMGVDSVVALQVAGHSTALVERSHADGDWQELFRRDTVVHDPAVSADGGRIAFSEWVNGHYVISEWNRSDRSIRTVASSPGDHRYPAYSPSDRWLFYSENVSGEWNIVRFSKSDNLRVRITSSESNDLMPQVSSDERTLYFASDRRRGYRYTAIYKMTLR